MLDYLKDIAMNPDIAIWASWVSFASFLGVLYNSWRLSKIARFIDAEHDKIVDTIKPFDLYLKIQEATSLLPKKVGRGSATIGSQAKRQTILDSLNGSSECLRIYFREIHGLSIKRENFLIDVAHKFLHKRNIVLAFEYYTKSFERAQERKDEAEQIECLFGLRRCLALRSNYRACAEINIALKRLLEGRRHHVEFKDQLGGGLEVVAAKSRIAFDTVFPWLRPKSPVPPDIAFSLSELQRLIHPGIDQSPPDRTAEESRSLHTDQAR